jgi:hypothetical protein
MVLQGSLVLQVLSLDTAGACAAKTAVQFVIVQRAIRLVVEDVELGRAKRLRASSTNETRLVVLSSQSTIRGRDAFSLNR